MDRIAWSNELVRLSSFSSFPRDIDVSLIRLANNGFYHVGQSSQTKCYSCGITYHNWKSGDDPSKIHSRISPNCSLLKNETENYSLMLQNNGLMQPSSTNPKTNVINGGQGKQHTEQCNCKISASVLSSECNQSTRESTKSNQSKNMSTLSNQSTMTSTERNPSTRIPSSQSTRVSTEKNQSITMSTVSNQSTMTSTESENVSTENSQSNNMSAMSNQSTRVSTESNQPKRTSTTNNQYLVNSDTIQFHGSKNNSSENTSNELSFNCQHEWNVSSPFVRSNTKPNYPNYSQIQVRVSSYKGWPSYLDQTPRDMAMAGFVFAGHSDFTRCFHCGGGLRNWEAGDIPWVEHARWFPKCTYVKENKGDKFIEEVMKRQKELVRN